MFYQPKKTIWKDTARPCQPNLAAPLLSKKRNGQHDIFRDQQVVPQKDEITAFPRRDRGATMFFFVLAYSYPLVMTNVAIKNGH